MRRFRWSQWLEQVVVPCLPAAFRHGKMPYLFLFEALLTIVLLTFPLINPYHQAPMTSVGFGLAMVLQMVLISRGMHLSQAIHLICLIGVVYLIHAAWTSGGLFSPRLSWLLILPVIPFYIIGPRAGYLWLGMVFVAQMGVAVLTGQGWLLQTLPSDDAQSSYAFATFAMVTVMLVLVPLVYDRQYRAALRESRLRQQELEKKQEELEQALELREHFIASVSHELRTPMNAILGFNSLLIKRVHNKPRAQEILAHTRQSADHLMTVINDVLDYSQFLSGRLTAHAETFALRETVRHAFDLFVPCVKSMQLAYRCEIEDDVPEWVSTDRHRLMQILVNLLGNALKFTHQGEVVLRVQWNNPGVLFKVEDTGIGIPFDDQPHIFTRFMQAQGEIQKRYGGNGLGLAITQGLVELLDGEIGFDSTPGQGSCFWFSLPLSAQQAPRPVQAQAAKVLQTASQAWHFLVVDDHGLNRLLVKQVLKNGWPACTVVEAENGAQALEKWRQQRFDLVFMDMVMPVMDGVQTTQAMRQSVTAHGLSPVIGLTANVNPQDLERFKDAGLSALLLKPFDPVQLCDEVEALLLRGAPITPVA
ncbi:ATP-binding protein [Limnohabitans sp.]|jgi:signal transduction histidine kinase/CheY-like chemotaxis protein|uniref:ATP-binding protein n=1 Tax=Limnohabitans sp. TaxID=1907725 RepID=UPI0037BE94A1